jgi:hypothetical protein
MTTNSGSPEGMGTVETIWLGVTQRAEGSVYFTFSSPVSFFIFGMAVDSPAPVGIQSRGIALYGSKEYKPVDPSVRWSSGDYSIGIGASSAETISGVTLQVRTEPISNLVLYQLLAGVTRLVGGEPSHLLSQVSRSTVSNSPIHRKVRTNLEEVTKLVAGKLDQITTQVTEISSAVQERDQRMDERITSVDNRLTALNNHVVTLKQPSSGESSKKEPVIDITEVTRLKANYEALYKKLQEAEDVIEEQEFLLSRR